MAEGMLTEGLKAGNYTEIELDGQVCRLYKDSGKVECKGVGETEFTPRAVGKDLPPLGDLKLEF